RRPAIRPRTVIVWPKRLPRSRRALVLADEGTAFEDISEGSIAAGDWNSEGSVSFKSQVNQCEWPCRAVRNLNVAELAGIDARLYALPPSNGCFGMAQVGVARQGHLEAGGQVQPKLQRLDPVWPRHFAMHDAAARRLELRVAWTKPSLATGMVLMQ